LDVEAIKTTLLSTELVDVPRGKACNRNCSRNSAKFSLHTIAPVAVAFGKCRAPSAPALIVEACFSLCELPPVVGWMSQSANRTDPKPPEYNARLDDREAKAVVIDLLNSTGLVALDLGSLHALGVVTTPIGRNVAGGAATADALEPGPHLDLWERRVFRQAQSSRSSASAAG
jgi:hypothetical protein